SPSDGAGSVETTSTRRPASLSEIASAAAQVVLPTPPFPPTNRQDGGGRRSVVAVDRRMIVPLERGFDAGDAVVLGRQGGGAGALPAIADLAQPLEDCRLERVELVLAQLPEFEPHLRREQLLAERRIVVQFRIDGGGDLVEDETEAADEDRVEDEHVGPSLVSVAGQCARSSFSRMLTKLYGGQGPVYLNVSLS